MRQARHKKLLTISQQTKQTKLRGGTKSPLSLKGQKMEKANKITTFSYRNVRITIYVSQTRFGSVFEASDDIGEPVMERLGFSTLDKAVESGKYQVDEYLDHN